MAGSDPLLDVAVALADGATVDWASAAQSITVEDDRRLLDELRFIAGMVCSTRGDGLAAAGALYRPGTFWGPLKIIEHIGRGTFGDVYRAWDSRLDREVALKVLRRKARDDSAHASTVIEEGRLLARVRHPSVVTVYGAERVGGQVGVWMEFVQGRTLEQELRDRGPFDVERVIRIGIDLSGALSSVHRAGLIHRDVKAQNVMYERDGRLVLTDFGAGREIDDTPDDQTRDLAGTPVCLAPEVLAGQPATPGSDVYSLGVLLYHVLTGAYPVRGRSLNEVREAHARGTRTSLAVARPDLPDPLVHIVDVAIDPDPDQRYESPEVLGTALASLGSWSTAEPGASAVGNRRTWRAIANDRRWWLAALAMILVGSVSLWLAVASTVVGRGPARSSSDGSLNPEIELAEIVTLTEAGRLEEAHERAVRARSAMPMSPAAASAAAYTLTYAGFLNEAVQAIDDALAADPDFVLNNAWWTPTALLYQRRLGQFLDALRSIDTASSRLYRALADVERGQRTNAAAHVERIEGSSTNVFIALAQALHAGLTGRRDAAAATVRSIAERRRAAGDIDGEVTFKQAQILSVAGEASAALEMLDDAVAQGFVCVACFDTSTLLESVRALPDYRRVRSRALDRQRAFARRFGLPTPATPLRAP